MEKRLKNIMKHELFKLRAVYYFWSIEGPKVTFELSLPPEKVSIGKKNLKMITILIEYG